MKKSKVIEGLSDFQPLLEIQYNDEQTVISGIYQINALVFNKLYLENFEIKITVTGKYPHDIPQIYVLGNRLDKCEHRQLDGELCLEAESNLKIFLRKNPTLKEFLVEFLTPFLVGFLYYEEYGEYLFGERQHGNAGIIEMYQERFETKNINTILRLLEIIAQKKYRGHMLCPCNSKKRIRKCHGQNSLLINMINSPDQRFYTDDFNTLLKDHQVNKHMRLRQKTGANILRR